MSLRNASLALGQATGGAYGTPLEQCGLKRLDDHYYTQQCLVLGAHMKRLLLATAITFAPFIIPADASGIAAEALAYACRGNVPDLKREKDTEENAALCNAYISGWDDARFAFLQGTTTSVLPKLLSKI
jgi:hypothetical protein